MSYYRRLSQGCVCRNNNECSDVLFCCRADNTCQPDCRFYRAPPKYQNLTAVCGSRDPSYQYSGGGATRAALYSVFSSCFYICFWCALCIYLRRRRLRAMHGRGDDSSDYGRGYGPGRPQNVIVVVRQPPGGAQS